MPDMTKILFIANPIAGRHSKGKIRDRIAAKLDGRGVEWDFVYTDHPGHATELAGGTDADVVVAIGGDGTVSEVARALVGTEKALGIIPCGSGDGLARHLKISHIVDYALKTILEMRTVTIDHGTINGQPFFCTCGVGLDAIVSMKFSQAARRGLPVYIEEALKTWIHFKPQHYRLTIDGKPMETEAVLITVGNANQWGNEGFIAPAASLNDGYLDITIIKPFLSVEIPLLAAMILDGHIDNSPRVKCIKCRSVSIHREEKGEAHFDGDPLILGKDIDIQIVPASLKVVVPAKRADSI